MTWQRSCGNWAIECLSDDWDETDGDSDPVPDLEGWIYLWRQTQLPSSHSAL